MTRTVRDLVLEYVTAVGDRRFDDLAELVHPDATFGGTVGVETRGANAFVQGFRNLGPILLRNEVRHVIVEGEHAFVLYDFVTDTPVGAVLCGEMVTTQDGLILTSTLIFDWRRWPEVLQELQRRTAAPARPQPSNA